VVSQKGATTVSRAGAALLRHVGLEALVSETPDGYVRAAASLARDLVALNELRAGLRQRVASSPLGDAPRFARDFEATLREAWLRGPRTLSSRP
jgi:predicted O-linked N-acetylglucosamine transferase (SPINDLY family)